MRIIKEFNEKVDGLDRVAETGVRGGGDRKIYIYVCLSICLSVDKFVYAFLSISLYGKIDRTSRDK